MLPNPFLKQELLKKYPKCQVKRIAKGRLIKCIFGDNGEPAASVDLHHGIFGKDKRFRKHINVEQNYQPACPHCNGGKFADTYSNRKHWIEHQVELRGIDYMLEWLASFPEGKKRGQHWKEAYQILMELDK